MFKSKLPHMLCAKCHSKVARDAYYCKNCGEVVDTIVAPGLKIEDRRFSSKFSYAIHRHLIRNIVIGILFILFIAGGIKFGQNYLKTLSDNRSSKIFVLTVVHPPQPMTCQGTVCHILIDIKNKTAVIQKITAIPDLVSKSGQKFGPADPSLMGNGPNYCEPKISIILQPHQKIQFLGICSQDIPIGTKMDLVELRDASGKLMVSGSFNAIVY